MTYKVSTGLRNHMLATGSLRAALAGGFINIYSGAEPASADDAPTGTLLCTISLNSTATGLDLDAAAAGGVIAKPAGAVWSGVNMATGTAGYYRHVGAADTGASSTTQPRFQGRIGGAGAEMFISNTGLVSGATQSLDNYSIQLPTL